jgi:hypothetical protein
MDAVGSAFRTMVIPMQEDILAAEARARIEAMQACAATRRLLSHGPRPGAGAPAIARLRRTLARRLHALADRVALTS